MKAIGCILVEGFLNANCDSLMFSFLVSCICDVLVGHPTGPGAGMVAGQLDEEEGGREGGREGGTGRRTLVVIVVMVH